MNKKEILEIRKQFSPENCAITRICGCYVDGDKEKKLEFKEAFLSLPEEETFKYYDIFKRTLSGTLGKNLINMGFPLEQELKGGTQDFLMQLRDSKLTDDDLISEFYDKVIEYYDYVEHYLILLIHAAYDVPGRPSDGSEMFDASDSVYDYILCSICPVSLSKAGLAYNAVDDRIENRIRDWIVGKPDKGFLFPAFNDRSVDVHNVLYYTSKSSDLQEGFIGEVLGANIPISAECQKTLFQDIVSEVLNGNVDYKTMQSIHEELMQMLEEHIYNDKPAEIDKSGMREVLEKCGICEERMESFDQIYDEAVGRNGSFLVSNIAETKNFNVKTSNASVRVDAERAYIVEVKMIDGRPYIVIESDGEVEVNGTTLTILK